MTTRFRPFSVLCTFAAAALAASAVARAETAQPAPAAALPPVVVTATRTPTPLDRIASAMTVITGEEIERNQYRNLADALKSVPGLNVVQNGGIGKTTSVFMRGTNSNHTLVLLNGIEVNDPSSPNGFFNFGEMLTDDIERIEIVRGAQSTLYGSDAIGGVINIITKQGSGTPKVGARLEGGSFGTFTQSAHVSGGDAWKNYALSVAHYDTDGFSLTPQRRRPGIASKDNGYENTSVSTRLGWTPFDNFEASGFLRYENADNQLETSPSDPNSVGHDRNLYLRGESRLGLFDGMLESRGGVSYTRYDRTDDNPSDTLSADFAHDTNIGQKLKFDLQNDVRFLDGQIFTLGLETENERIDSNALFAPDFTTGTTANVNNKAIFFQQQIALFDRLFASVGVRIDDHDRFGRKTTWRFAPTYHLAETGTRFKFTYGTGFKAPTLFQLFGHSEIPGFTLFSGNPNLLPETSRGWDVGVEQEFEPFLGLRGMRVGATYFDTDVKNLIDSTPAFDSLENKANAKLRGVEAFGAVDILTALSARLDYTYTQAEDGVTGGELLRRPKQKGSVSTTYRPDAAAQVSLIALMTGRQSDFDPDLFTPISLAGRTVVNLAGSYDVSDVWRAYARIENLFDRNYEEPRGFLHGGIGGFVGVRANY